jgi:hypothetical protein
MVWRLSEGCGTVKSVNKMAIRELSVNAMTRKNILHYTSYGTVKVENYVWDTPVKWL